MIMRVVQQLSLVALLAWSTTAWTLSTPGRTPPSESTTTSTRKDFLTSVLQTTVLASGVAALSRPGVAVAAEGDEVTLPSGVSYRIVKSGTGAKPEVGELAAIRFAAYFNDIKIDDIFDTPEPYYTRVGSGGLIKGVEEVLPTMQTGDRWVLTIPVRLVVVEEEIRREGPLGPLVD